MCGEDQPASFTARKQAGGCAKRLQQLLGKISMEVLEKSEPEQETDEYWERQIQELDCE